MCFLTADESDNYLDCGDCPQQCEFIEEVAHFFCSFGGKRSRQTKYVFFSMNCQLLRGCFPGQGGFNDSFLFFLFFFFFFFFSSSSKSSRCCSTAPAPAATAFGEGEGDEVVSLIRFRFGYGEPAMVMVKDFFNFLSRLRAVVCL